MESLCSEKLDTYPKEAANTLDVSWNSSLEAWGGVFSGIFWAAANLYIGMDFKSQMSYSTKCGHEIGDDAG